jgi:hypothetical protein
MGTSDNYICQEGICSICFTERCDEMYCNTCTSTKDKLVCKCCINKMLKLCSCHKRDFYYSCPHCRTKIVEPKWVDECLESRRCIVRLLRSSK